MASSSTSSASAAASTISPPSPCGPEKQPSLDKEGYYNTETGLLARQLPITFRVKYLGSDNATGLWGIKHTRRPLDQLVSAAKALPSFKAAPTLPMCNLTVSLDGVSVETASQPDAEAQRWTYSIETISYGVQDLVYTRVFSMIIVKENYQLKDSNPFKLHAFLCESRAVARKLTFTLAASFYEYTKRVNDLEKQQDQQQQQQQQENSAIAASDTSGTESGRKKFAIDLRTAEEMQQDIDELETEA